MRAISSSSSVYLFNNKTVGYKYTVTNVDTNEVETGMTRLIALTVTPVRGGFNGRPLVQWPTGPPGQ